jgi:hypothetical protein
MASFTTRVELHGASPADYEALHRYMAEANFSRLINGDDGVQYMLPTAEYQSFGNLTVTEVRELAEHAAARTGRTFWVLVTETVSRAWRLQPVRSAVRAGILA